MSVSRWQRVDALFHAALEREGNARESFLREACGEDHALFTEITSLIAAHESGSEHSLDRVGEEMAADWASTTVRPSLVGQRVDRYEVVAALGSGGMGDVYRATDTALGRDVALKVLRPALHTDSDFRRRLAKEARAASMLNHPNIVTVYEIGLSGSVDFVASELVDGMTLRERLAAGPLSIREIVDIGGQVAAALSTAHGAGIVHRDIKPENVMIRRDGIVKVVDFGLALRTSPSGAKPESIWRALTQSGVVAGTASYMSPEQALGEPIDHRSDLFSVGVVLYEMATALRPFGGGSDAAMYDALLHAAPPVPSTLRAGLPTDLDLVIGRALEKDRDLRYQSAADLGSDLKRLLRPTSSAALTAAQPPRRVSVTRVWQVATVFALLLASTLGAMLVLRRPVADVATTRFIVGPPPNASFTLMGLGPSAMTMSVSPDGRRVLYIAGRPNSPGRLWVRPIDSVEATPLDDTEGAVFAFWSPDGRSIGFLGAGLKRKELSGGTPRTLAGRVPSRGGTWNRDGVILYGTANGGIFRVSAEGGDPSPVTTPDATQGETAHRYPQFLPDGRHFLYLSRSADVNTLFVGSLDGGVRKRLLDTNARAVYAEPGYLFYMGEKDALMARPFDARTLEFAGEAVEVAGPIARSSLSEGSFAVGGPTLVYAGQAVEMSRLVWFDRSGRSIGTVGAPGQYQGVRLSPDGRSAAFTRMDPNVNTTDIWLLDLERDVESRFTSNPLFDVSPVWSPDGSRIVFSSNRDGFNYQLFQRPVAGGATESRLFSRQTESPYPEDWAPDGRSIVYASNPMREQNDLTMLRLDDLHPTTLVGSRYSDYEGRVSPDGHWLAYTSDESGRPEIYVRPFPSGTSVSRISLEGGSQPSWRGDGRELFYVAADGGMMSVPMVLSPAIKSGRPTELFRAHLPGDPRRRVVGYAVTADGNRFLIPTLIDAPQESSITVILNWLSAVKGRS